MNARTDKIKSTAITWYSIRSSVFVDLVQGKACFRVIAYDSTFRLLGKIQVNYNSVAQLYVMRYTEKYNKEKIKYNSKRGRNMDSVKIGNFISELRKEKNMTQKRAGGEA